MSSQLSVRKAPLAHLMEHRQSSSKPRIRFSILLNFYSYISILLKSTYLKVLTRHFVRSLKHTNVGQTKFIILNSQ